jgi:hypothetical protein
MFDFGIIRFLTEPREAPHRRQEIEKRMLLMKALALKGYVDVNPHEHDLAGAGIAHLETLSENKARYGPLEPLMLHALYRHLEEDQQCDFNHLIFSAFSPACPTLSHSNASADRISSHSLLV